MVRWTLDHHATRVNAATLPSRYGIGPASEQAARCVRRATRQAAAIGATAGAIVSTVELLDVFTLGASMALAAPLITADLGATLRTQLCAAYDLALIHGAPLSLDDRDDCHIALMTALGAKPSDALATESAALLPTTLAHGARKLLRSGMQKTLVVALHRVARPWLAKRVTERALLGLVPGVNIPLAAGINGYFTRRVVNAANEQMKLRAAIARPLLRLVDAGVAPLVVLGAVASTLSTPDRAGRTGPWTDAELTTLQTALAIARVRDEEAAALDTYFERDPRDVGAELRVRGGSKVDLRELLVLVAARGTWDDDAIYAQTVATIVSGDQASIATEIRARRAV
jgi:hypothetical protein